jgi:hypothetical protein
MWGGYESYGCWATWNGATRTRTEVAAVSP